MSYQVLARKWRPRTFTEVVGQQHVLQALTNALTHQRLHHAYLLTGTRGVGKTTIARILSRSLNCEQGITPQPCGQCSSCVDIEAGRFVDLMEIDAASRTKVEDTREILENVQYRPTAGRYKVYLIDEVHMLSRHSFNALLKTLEEPPPHVIFLLATTDPDKLPVTVLSRCLQFNLRGLTRDEISGQLQHILKAEHIQFDEAALALLARSANGSMRDALSLTDQAIAQGNQVVSEQVVAQMLGRIDAHNLLDLIAAFHQGEVTKTLQLLRDLLDRVPDISVVLTELQTLLHQLALVQVAPNLLDSELVAHRGQMEALARTIPAPALQVYYRLVIDGRRELPFAVDAFSGVEMTLLRLAAFRPQSAEDEAPGKSPTDNAAATDVVAANPVADNPVADGSAADNPAAESPVAETASAEGSVAESAVAQNAEAAEVAETKAPDYAAKATPQYAPEVTPTSKVDEVGSTAKPLATAELKAEPKPERQPAPEAKPEQQPQAELKTAAQPPGQPSVLKEATHEFDSAVLANDDAFDFDDEDDDLLALIAEQEQLEQRAQTLRPSSTQQPSSTPKQAVQSSTTSNLSGLLATYDSLLSRKKERSKSGEQKSEKQSEEESVTRTERSSKLVRTQDPVLSEPTNSEPMPNAAEHSSDQSEWVANPPEVTSRESEFEPSQSEARSSESESASRQVEGSAGQPTEVKRAAEIDDWSKLVDSLEVVGRTRQVLLNAMLHRTAEGLRLEVDEQQRALLSGHMEASLRNELSKVMDTSNLSIELGQPQDTPFLIQQRIDAERLAAAQERVQAHPLIQRLQSELAAHISSVKVLH
ncbi:MAG: DNA polymerase III subunit gamma/tau [Aliidiomarina sp.]|uniref:DNA polymerase III subunit gamma/tau n=1 Tax=Aliidiomarina sp. TaxID=1872439 RepID=UPI0025C6EB8F|nr:DNA polymerase III subunit gamma/tau [Aliidiomarina sp.]MCH8501481.1 DNA polymerase III subunit gamma/tau [Aliidiomarina sp.]